MGLAKMFSAVERQIFSSSDPTVAEIGEPPLGATTLCPAGNCPTTDQVGAEHDPPEWPTAGRRPDRPWGFSATNGSSQPVSARSPENMGERPLIYSGYSRIRHVSAFRVIMG
jgi:hypothetical protein